MEFFDTHTTVEGDLRGPIISKRNKAQMTSSKPATSSGTRVPGSIGSLPASGRVLVSPSTQRTLHSNSQRTSSSSMPSSAKQLTAKEVVQRRLESDTPKNSKRAKEARDAIPNRGAGSKGRNKGDGEGVVDKGRGKGKSACQEERREGRQPFPLSVPSHDLSSPPSSPDSYARTPKPRNVDFGKKTKNKPSNGMSLRISTQTTFDSPDPMLLTPSSDNPSIPSPTSSIASQQITSRGSTSKRVLVPPSSSAATKHARSSQAGKAKKRASSDISSSTDSDDSEATPKAKPQKKKTMTGGPMSKLGEDRLKANQGSPNGVNTIEQKKKKKKKTIPQEEDEVSEDDATAFFKGLKRLGDKEKQRIRAKRGDSDADEAVSNISEYCLLSSPVFAPVSNIIVQDKDENDDLGGPTAEERSYCRQFIDDEESCDYCGGDLPASPSRHLQNLKSGLVALAAEHAVDGRLSWQRTIGYCTQHKAETTVIPLGIRAGFSADIDFLAIGDRLEENWLRREIEDIMVDPDRTSLFYTIVEDIRQKGKGRWNSMGHQTDQTILSRTMPGYYGHLGRTILLQHYLNLLHWGLLPELDVDPIDGTYPTSPLTPLEFITHVVVPEAAILLIMGDQGWTGEYNDTTEQWGKARQKAYNTWLKSGEYGRARFSTDDAEGKDILSSIQDRTKEIKRACKRRRKGKIVKKPLVAPRSVSPVKRSGSRHPIEVVNIELDSSQSTLDKSRSRQSSITLDTATPKGRQQSPFRVEFSPVSPLAISICHNSPRSQTEAVNRELRYRNWR